jgi:hypothetical protein
MGDSTFHKIQNYSMGFWKMKKKFHRPWNPHLRHLKHQNLYFCGCLWKWFVFEKNAIFGLNHGKNHEKKTTNFCFFFINLSVASPKNRPFEKIDFRLFMSSFWKPLIFFLGALIGFKCGFKVQYYMSKKVKNTLTAISLKVV